MGERGRLSNPPQPLVDLDLWPVLVALMKWGDRYHAPHGPPRILQHRNCGGEISDQLVCAGCGEGVTVASVVALPGPGAAPEQRPTALNPPV